jgi:predicted AAA+ superfamily ATPase
LKEPHLYKDILSWEKIRKPEKVTRLMKALALQVGAQVSYNELAGLCGLDAKTVEKYICVLEQAYEFQCWQISDSRKLVRMPERCGKTILFRNG